MKHSAYRSMQLAKENKTKKKDGNLRKWINEDWRNLTPYAENIVNSLKDTPECGKPHPRQKGKTICRPLKKLDEKTPKLASSYSKKQLKEAVKLKNQGKRITWSKLIGGNASKLTGLGYALGDDDIKEVLPDAKIMDYEQLRDYNSIDELLPNNGDYVILLYEHQQNSGHWCLVMKLNDRIEFFCSYGTPPDGQLKWVDYNIRKELKSDVPHLSYLFDTCPYDVVYNDVPFQGKDESIATCGKYCVVRVLTAKDGLPLEEFEAFMKKSKPKGQTYDDYINQLFNQMT